MYFTHFALREPPFGLTPDTSFVFACTPHQEALNTLPGEDEATLVCFFDDERIDSAGKNCLLCFAPDSSLTCFFKRELNVALKT